MAEIDPLRALGLLRDEDLAGEAPSDLGQDQGLVQEPLRSGETIEGRLRLLRPIGAGGMGSVFLAEDASSGRKVAVKVLSLEGDAGRERFRREAELTARLRHPNVIQIHGSGSCRGYPYLEYEWVEGARDLEEAFEGCSLDERLDLLEQACEGLAAAHREGIVHRDLKPENLLVRPGGEVLVADFGLAGVGTRSLTQTGQMLGTPAWMSPEQIRGEEVTPACDVWALGLLLYLAICGEHPFLGDGGGLHALLARVLAARVESPKASAPLQGLLRRSLSANPSGRPPDAGAFLAALREARALAPGRAGRRLLWAAPLLPVLLVALHFSTAPPQDSEPAPAQEPGAGPELASPLPSAQLATGLRAEWSHTVYQPRDAAFLGGRLLLFGGDSVSILDPRGKVEKRLVGRYQRLEEGRDSVWLVAAKKTFRLGEDLRLEALCSERALGVDSERGEFLVAAEGRLELRRRSGRVLRSFYPPVGKLSFAKLFPRRVLVVTKQAQMRRLYVAPRAGSGQLKRSGLGAVRLSAALASADGSTLVLGNVSGALILCDGNLRRVRVLQRTRTEGSRLIRLARQAHLNMVKRLFLWRHLLLSWSRSSGEPSTLVLWNWKERRALAALDWDALGARALALSPEGRLAVVYDERVVLLPLAELGTLR